MYIEGKVTSLSEAIGDSIVVTVVADAYCKPLTIRT